MRAVIICGGNAGEYIKAYIKESDFIICADSGYDHAVRLGIKPDVVIGDMDSVKCGLDGENTLIYPTHKDFTDSELAIEYAKNKGAGELLLFGMIGTRMDHTLANISLLKYAKNARIIDKSNEIYFVDREIEFSGKKGDIISIIPFEGDTEGVTTVGLYYPLSDETVKSGTSLGVSNEMTGDFCRITVKKGKAFVIKSRDLL